ADTFYLSFNRNAGTAVPGLGAVYDEDIVLYNAGTWSLYFEGSVYGLAASNGQDIDAFDIAGGVLYFSTFGSVAVPGVAGPYDDADIYAWDGGAAFRRVFDASAAGLPATATIDGLKVVDADTFYMSFSADLGTAVAGLGVVQDEDVVLYDAGTWSLHFDGSVYGLAASGGQDIDAFDLLP
ncbi:MAG: hypothetical protein HY900_20770, partial [Deltaproteobacteria bacterium]|nr:hypothetical protein [Deltaproteobacteria bacterium]